LIVAIIVTITRAICLRGISSAYPAHPFESSAWCQSSHDMPSPAENTPIVPKNSLTVMLYSTWTFLKTCSESGAAGAAAWPPTRLTAISHAHAVTPTPNTGCRHRSFILYPPP